VQRVALWNLTESASASLIPMAPCNKTRAQPVLSCQTPELAPKPDWPFPSSKPRPPTLAGAWLLGQVAGLLAGWPAGWWEAGAGRRWLR
jgi:hypothetical protein